MQTIITTVEGTTFRDFNLSLRHRSVDYRLTNKFRVSSVGNWCMFACNVTFSKNTCTLCFHDYKSSQCFGKLTAFPGWSRRPRPVSSDIVSLPKTIRGMNMDYTGIEYPIKTNIRHKIQPVNAKRMQCQCIVS